VLGKAHQVKLVKVDELVPYARNARTHSAAQVAKIAASITEFGFNNPVLTDGARGVIAGHGRLAAAKLLGLAEVPVIELAHLDDVQKRAYILADNRLAEDAGWDQEMLAGEVRDLAGTGFELAITGFSDAELDDMLEDPPEDGQTGANAAPPAVPAVPCSSIGDAWHLGRHRLICGDSTDAAVLGRLMRGDLADLVWTDPPYNVNYGDKAEMQESSGKAHRNTSRILNDNLPADAFFELLYGAFLAAFGVMKEGAAIYVAHADTEGIAFRTAFARAGFYLSSCLIWRKNALVLGRSDYHWQHEPILYGWKPGAGHKFYGGRNKTTMLELGDDEVLQQIGDNAWQISLGERSLVISGDNLMVSEAHGTVFLEEKPPRNDVHPTMKPVPLVSRMIKNSSKRGAIVLDLFGGSGSTLIACEQTEREARLVELAPGYCDVIVERWQNLTGKAATLASDGRTFADVKAARAELVDAAA